MRATRALFLGRVEGVLVFAPYLLLLLGSLVPRVEDPLPDEIGIDFPFAVAAGWGVLASLIYFKSSLARRESAVRRGVLLGFGLGAVVYLVALVVQVGFS